MTSAVPKGVFISYSRVNGEVVSIAAKLLRAGGATVFQDVVDIEYGSDWQEALARAIRQCERVLVFWSLAASTSEWVEREWRMALQAGKRIVPMLLDKTPLPAELSRFNGMPELMQFLMLVKQPPQAAHAPPPSPARSLPPSRPAPMRQRGPRFMLPAIGVAFATVFCGVLFYVLLPSERPGDVVATATLPASGAVPVGPASAPASATADAAAAPGAGWSVAIIVALLLAGLIARFLFRRRKSKSKPAPSAVRTDEDAEAFPLEPSRRPPWQNTDIPDFGRPAAADTQARLVQEIGPLFTRRLFD